jgi:RIO kinase 1
MSERELASARSYWKRSQIRAGRRSRYVEVAEMSPDRVAADAIESGLVDEVLMVLGSGKEADCYLCRYKGVLLVLKVYRLHRTPHKKRTRTGYAVDRMGSIAAREFTILQKAYRSGVPVPTPARRVDNMFTMRYLGDEAKAPLLKDSYLENAEDAAVQALGIVRDLVNARMVHGDLSEYNVLLWNSKLFVIDFPQAVDFSSNVDRHIRIEEAKPLLLRDLNNLKRYFAEYSVDIDVEEEYTSLLSKLQP